MSRARRKYPFPFTIINSANLQCRIAERVGGIIINDNDVLNSLSIVRDKRHDLARKQLYHSIWVASGKKELRGVSEHALHASRRNSEKVETDPSFLEEELRRSYGDSLLCLYYAGDRVYMQIPTEGFCRPR